MAAHIRIPSFVRRSWRAWRAGLVAVVAAASLSTAAAAPQPARIEGHVTGQGGAPLDGARVTLAAVDAPSVLVENADSEGAFVFARVPPGAYHVTVDIHALHATSGEPLEFEAGKAYTLDLPMVPPAASR